MIRNRFTSVAALAALPRVRLALVPSAALLLFACASTPPPNNPTLNEARALYNQAVNDESTARSAPLELRKAQQALQQAEAALKAGKDPSAVDHYAYLARQRAATAMQSGVIARAEASATESTADRGRILMEARAREAEASTAAAIKAREEAQRALAQAEQARMDAEKQLALTETARARAAKLQQELADLQAKQTDRGMVLTLGDVLFDTGRAELKSGAFSTVDRLANFLRENPERMVAIEGHTDTVGSESYNLALSEKRAEAVRTALLSRGIAGIRVTSKGIGESTPVASNATAEGRQRNRRVEIIIADAK
ncbi:OmpA family protein [Hydrogenophaga sp.]|uniref:OmpA family protein n=1 Tax=Hydrogenophaga sp. TaxID=1904254 RepID=UPI0025B80F62|nr:OmpA family protein [Hydrogenophaga sp.]